MSQNIGTLISASIRPNDSLDPIASAFANEIKGGLHSCADAAARNAIITQRREWGMLAYVTTEDVMYQLQYGYYDTTITNNLNWTVFTGGAQSQITNEWIDSVISIKITEPVTPTNPDRYMLGTSSSASITGTNWDSFTATSIVEWNTVTSTWKVIVPTNGATVRADTEKNLMYRFDGTFPSGEWKPEKVAQIFYISPSGANDYTATTSPAFSTYEKDVIFLAKFIDNNFGTSSLNINGIGAKSIKVNTTIGIRDLIDGDITTTALYSLTYDGTYFQMVKPFSSDAQNIKYYIAPDETITVGEFEQYWVYGDLTIDGSLINHGNIVIANGAFVNNSNDFQNYGTLTLVDIKTPIFNDTLAIGFTSSVTTNGSSFSAYLKNSSLLPVHLDTNIGGPTAGYTLSVDSEGLFEWVAPIIQNNIKRYIPFTFPGGSNGRDVLSKSQFLNIINALTLTIEENEIVIFRSESNTGSIWYVNLVDIGKGTYGAGGIALTSDNIEITSQKNPESYNQIDDFVEFSDLSNQINWFVNPSISYDFTTTFLVPSTLKNGFRTQGTVKEDCIAVFTASSGVTIQSKNGLTVPGGTNWTLVHNKLKDYTLDFEINYLNNEVINLPAYPSTRDDGQLSTNKVLSTDINGNLKMYRIATSPPPYLKVLVPESTLPSTTTNFILRGSFFTPTMTVSIVGQTINYKTFISDNEVRVNVTTGATEGLYDVTLNNGLSVTFPNALLIVLGDVFMPASTDWINITGNIDVSEGDEVHTTLYNSAGNATWNKLIDNTKDWYVRFNLALTPLGQYSGGGGTDNYFLSLVNATTDDEDYKFSIRNDGDPALRVRCFGPTSSNYITNYIGDTYNEQLAYLGNQSIEFRKLGSTLYVYLNNGLAFTFPETIVDDYNLLARVKSWDIINIKYIELL